MMIEDKNVDLATIRSLNGPDKICHYSGPPRIARSVKLVHLKKLMGAKGV